MKAKAPNLVAAQTLANDYARAYVKTHPLALPVGLDDEQFAAAVEAALRAIAEGWAAGYMQREREVRGDGKVEA